MHRRHTILIAAFLCLFFSACRRSTDDKLVGRWEVYFGTAEVGMAKAVVTYAKDHTVVASVETNAPGRTTGNWRVEADQIITSVTSSTVKKTNEGKEFRQTIVRLEKDVLVLKDSDGKVLTYERLK